MLAESIEGVDFICLNTDAQALTKTKAKIALQLGEDITKGLGAGADPEVGRLAAEADRADLAVGDDVDPAIRKAFERPEAAYIHAHNAAHGCFSARIDRA